MNIGIPTRGRPEKLSTCLRSIDDIGVQIFIYCYDKEEDLEEGKAYKAKVHEDKAILTISSHNKCCNENEGSFLGISDDIKFHDKAIYYAGLCLLSHFPDTDGVVYLNVVNMESVAGAFMLLGDKFIDRFPNRMPYFPKYKFMRASSELRIVANKLNKVAFCEEAKIDHYHPSAGYKADDTHNRVRATGVLEEDRKLFEKRRSEDRLWGFNQFALD